MEKIERRNTPLDRFLTEEEVQKKIQQNREQYKDYVRQTLSDRNISEE